MPSTTSPSATTSPAPTTALAVDERRKPFRPSLSGPPRTSTPDRQCGRSGSQAFTRTSAGGYVDAGLSDRTFLWMCSNAKNASLGFHTEYMTRRIDPNLYGEMRDSMKWCYRILGPYPRPIGASDAAGEAVHWSARQRLEFVTEIAYRNRPDRAIPRKRHRRRLSAGHRPPSRRGFPPRKRCPYLERRPVACPRTSEGAAPHTASSPNGRQPCGSAPNTAPGRDSGPSTALQTSIPPAARRSRYESVLPWANDWSQ